GQVVKVAALQVSDPFTQRGTTNVAVIYELTDGQTVSVFFHNPDVTPKKIAAADDLVSWKWMLNKKDITVAVAPEKGRDLDIRMVASRIMELAEKNSGRFVAANGKRAERLQTIAELQTELDAKKLTLAELEKQVAAAQAARDAAGLAEPDPEEDAAAAAAEVAAAEAEAIAAVEAEAAATAEAAAAAEAAAQAERDAEAEKLAADLAATEAAAQAARDADAAAAAAAAAQAAREAEEVEQAAKAAKKEAEDEESADGDFLALASTGDVDFYDKAVTDRLAALARKYTDPDGAYLDLVSQSKTAAKQFFIAEFKKKVG
ncbi:MAG: hypothetical protein WKG03_00675, partial [Telluria sp.]